MWKDEGIPGFEPGSLIIHFLVKYSGRGSAWLERLVRDQEVPGSNPGAPTLFAVETWMEGCTNYNCESNLSLPEYNPVWFFLNRFTVVKILFRLQSFNSFDLVKMAIE